MSRLYPIASSSDGNCTYIGSGKNGIIVDAGISCRAICNGLSAIGVDAKNLLGIFITHEHTDHIAGLQVVCKRIGLPIFASTETLTAVIASLPEAEDFVHPFDGSVALGDMEIARFDTSHDCLGSSGYTVLLPDGKKCGVCTDLGFVSPQVHNALVGCDTLLFESNHDVNMLTKGSYPEHLKRRILSDVGHLSNIACAAELKRLAENGTNRIVLGHISRENNTPELAHACTVSALLDNGMKEDIDYTLYIAPPKGGKAIIF